MSLQQSFQSYWKQHFYHLLPANGQLLLAVSGGIDSIVLTDLMYKCGIDFVIAHCNFQLREAESERDEQFVKTLKDKYDKAVFVKKFDTKEYAAANKISIQEAARNIRYQWFQEIVNERRARGDGQKTMDNSRSSILNGQFPIINHIATAHHANDSIETMLINFFRGTGIGGLHGILPIQGNIIRPLLFANRKEIELYAKENSLSWVDDSSNISDKYTRNFFRLKLIPLVKEVFPNIEENLLNNIERFTETEILYRQAIELHKKKLIEQKGNEFHIPILKLQKSTPINSIVWELIKDFHFHAAQVPAIKKLFLADNGSSISSATHQIFKNRNWLIIAPLQTETAQHVLIESGNTKTVFENGVLILEAMNHESYKLQADNSIAALDATEVKFPLLLRKWKQGDYFYPLGMQKKKKLSRFFIDQKLSKTEKEKVWVLETNKKIIWIINYRIDDRFKITTASKKIIKISFKKI